MNKITVDFKDLNLTITKTRDEWVKELHEYCLAECAESCAYNDNTLSDFLMNGFKGFANMTDKELTEEIIYALESKYDTLEVK